MEEDLTVAKILNNHQSQINAMKATLSLDKIDDSGLSKLEIVSIIMLHGILSNPEPDKVAIPCKSKVQTAVIYAKRLLKETEEVQ